MSEIRDVSAFPNEANPISDRAGMTLRDYFAARAMQGLLADSSSGLSREDTPRMAYQIADGMLIVRAEDE